MNKSNESVGASLLAKNLNDNARFLNQRGACEFFASKLAPTILGKPPPTLNPFLSIKKRRSRGAVFSSQ
ncbi:hypothetical protein EUX57_18780 [Pseudomonas orientalis]|jgi:hypothetical protein|uniref:Uncharacterized protein n=1 Tax=Pseudomonas orientalis TaxID=76758 RepID=A0A4Q7D1P2_9PSED|nr:hypothetical protein EUX57_18780 [Pseudomonas orientalis]